MEQYAITLTVKDERNILYISNSKDDALAKGNEIFKTMELNGGTLSCIQAEFDADNKITNGQYRLIDTWL